MAMNIQIREPAKKPPFARLLKVTVDGKCTYVPTAHDLLEAQQHRLKLLDEYRKGQQIDRGSITLRQHFATWLAHKASRSSGKRLTGVVYETHGRLHILPVLGDVKLLALTQQQIVDWQNDLLTKPHGARRKPLGRRSVIGISKTLKQALRFAVNQRLIAASPMGDDTKIKLEQDVDQHLVMLPPAGATDKALQHFLDTGRSGAYIATLISHLTGARIGEVLALRWCDIDWGSKGSNLVAARKPRVMIARTVEHLSARLGGDEMVLPKSNKARWVSMPDRLVRALEAYRKHHVDEALQMGRTVAAEDHIVCDPLDGRTWNPNTFGRLFSNHAGFNFHLLRHEHASFLIVTLGMNVKRVQVRLGHSTPAITLNTYAHFFDLADSDEVVDAINRGDDGDDAQPLTFTQAKEK